MTMIAADTNLTASRVAAIANHPGRAGIWQGTVGALRARVSSLLGFSPGAGEKIVYCEIGLFDDAAFTTTNRIRIHLADEATALTQRGCANDITPRRDLSVSGWFDDLWVSANVDLACYVYVVLKPAKG